MSAHNSLYYLHHLQFNPVVTYRCMYSESEITITVVHFDVALYFTTNNNVSLTDKTNTV